MKFQNEVEATMRLTEYVDGLRHQGRAYLYAAFGSTPCQIHVYGSPFSNCHEYLKTGDWIRVVGILNTYSNHVEINPVTSIDLLEIVNG